MESLEEVFGDDMEPGRGLELYDEMVMALSGSIYGELEKLMAAYGQAAITGLMPLLVSVLEGLGEASAQARERQEQLELLQEDHQRLLGQFEQERDVRKRAEERCMETEDSAEQEQRGYQASLASLETQRKHMELKARGYADQVASLEEQRAALNKEFTSLTQTHSKLMKSYQDLRFQQSLALEAARQPGHSSPLPHSEKKILLLDFQEASSSLETITCHVYPESSGTDGEVTQTPDAPVGGSVLARSTCPVQLGSEMNGQTLQDELKPEEGAPQNQDERLLEVEEIIKSTPELELTSEHLKKSAPQWQAEESLEKEKENEEDDHKERNTDSLFAEVSVTSPELIADVDEGADLQGVGNSVEVLMAENANLRDIQMAVDGARKSLIARVEELTAEREDLKREVAAQHQNLGRGQAKIRETEQEVQRLRQELEEARKQSREDSEADTPAAQRRRFTRSEMSRVLMERNQYKERLMELQEAVRRTELLRVSRDVQSAQMRKSSFWKIFDRLFSSDAGERSSTGSPPQLHTPHPVPNVTYSHPPGSAARVSPLGGISSRDTSETDGDIAAVSVRQQKREQYRQIRAHIWNEHGREQLHGWSYPPALSRKGGQGDDRSGGRIPVLVQLRLLDQKDPSTKLWCAAGMCRTDSDRDAKKQAKPSPSLVWICSRTHSVSEVMVIDASRSNHVVDQFVIPNSHVLCISCVPGYRLDLVNIPEADQEAVTAAVPDSEVQEATPSHAATVWFGTQEGRLHIHPTVSNWRKCVQTVQLKDAIHSLVHTRDRVVAALGDGTLTIFHRNASRQWDLETPRVVELGRPPQSIRCAVIVRDKVWCGYRNRIYVVDPRMAKTEKWFEATSHPEKQVRHMAAAGDGVWVSVRLDATLRLFHAQTGQILQEVPLEPYVQKMLGCSASGVPFTQISALVAQCNRLWIGTAGGTIISIPFSAGYSNHSGSSMALDGMPNDSELTSSTMPYCSIDCAQICFHGHRDAVKFFAAVPGCINPGLPEVRETAGTLERSSGTQGTMLVMSGGEGYINLRIGDDTGDTDEGFGELLLPNPRHRRAERSHLIVWQVQT